MRKTFTYLSLLIAFMFAGTMSGWAQFKAEFTTDPVEGYVAGYVNLDPVEVAAAIDVDVADLKTAITTSGTYYIKTEDGRSNDYMGDNNQFWMNNDGYPRSYGSGEATWFSGIIWKDAGSDETTGETWSDSVSISFGQMPNTFKYVYEASVLKATTYLVVGEKEVSFEIIQNINAAPEPTLPDPVTKLSGLTIVGEWTLELPFYLGKQYEGLSFSTTLDGVYEALGVAQAELDLSASDYIYSQSVKVDSLKTEDGIATGEVVYSFADDLVKPSTTDGWYGRYINYDENTAMETPLPYNAPKSHGSDCTFYTQRMTLAEGVYTVGAAGQYPGTYTSAEESDFTYHYIIVGDKAAKIKIVTKLMEQQTLPLADMTQVGEETIEIQHYIGGSGGSFTLDLANLEALLGAGAINFEVLADASGTALSSNTTATKGGYWMTKEGYPINWGVEGHAIFVEPNLQGDFSAFNYGFNDGAWTLGDKTTVKLYFHNGTSYYLVNLNVEIIEQPQISEDEFENVETIGLVYQFIPNAEGYPLGTTQLDMEYISGLLGEGTYKLYTLTAPTADSPSIMTDSYNCDPKPGFWMNNSGETESYIGAWGGDASYGMGFTGGSVANGAIEWFNMPGGRVAGDEFYSTFFIVNMDNGKMVTLRINVKFVDTIVETEVVGEESLILVVADGEDPLYTAVNINALTEAYGVDVDLLEAAAEIKVLKTPTSFTADHNDSGYGWFLNESGCCVDLTDEEATMTAPVTLGYEWYNTEDAPLSFFTTSGVMAVAPADGVVYKTKMAIEYDAKHYIYNISLMNQATATGIEKVETATTKAGNVYDLTGRIVRKSATGVNGLANGIYILNGKKYIVK